LIAESFFKCDFAVIAKSSSISLLRPLRSFAVNHQHALIDPRREAALTAVVMGGADSDFQSSTTDPRAYTISKWAPL
jgi:hypothetical protein